MTTQYHILIVDDDNRMLKLLKRFLIQEGFLVSTSRSNDEALQLLSTFTYDLIVLDVMMPKTTGLEFASKIKGKGSIIPIVMLTALSEPEDRVRGLESGANDYVTKPFEPKELLLRVNNLIKLHCTNRQQQQLVRFGNNSYNLITKELRQDDHQVKLSSSEESLLDTLISEKNRSVSRSTLSQKLGELNLRSVDVQIARLRSKIESDPKIPQHLKTIRNKGYILYV